MSPTGLLAFLFVLSFACAFIGVVLGVLIHWLAERIG